MKAPGLRSIFGNYPYAFFATFDEAVSVAERCPEGCRVVWYFSHQSDNHPWRVGRMAEMVARDLADPGPWLAVAWKDGAPLMTQQNIEQIDRGAAIVLPRVEAEKPVQPGPPPLPAPPPPPPPRAKKTAPALQPTPAAAQPAVSIPSLIESLKAAGLPAEKILEIIAASTR